SLHSTTTADVTVAHQPLINPAKLTWDLSQSLRTKKSFGFHHKSESFPIPDCSERMSWPLRISTWAVAAMSSCNELPVKIEISPTTTAGCINKTSCNAIDVFSELTPSFAATCSWQTSCNGTCSAVFFLRQYPGWPLRHSLTRRLFSVPRKEFWFSGLCCHRR